MSQTDTHDFRTSSDTSSLQLLLGQRVKIGVGEMEGIEGTVIAHRADGKVLVQIGSGAFAEVHQFCLHHD